MTLNEFGRCSDPFKIGCTRQITANFCLPRTPHLRGPTPCQKCRARQIKERREREGRPLRTGRRLSKAL